MNQGEVVDIIREGIGVMVLIAAAPVLTGLIIGIAISLLQALTQIQEMTLTFVPKLLAIFGVIVLTLPFIIHELTTFTNSIFDRIAHLP